MYKQIIFLVLFLNQNFYLNAQKISVFEQNKEIGYLYEKTNYNCNNCYYYEKIEIFGRKITIKMESNVIREDDKTIFFPLYRTTVEKLNKNTKIIQFSSTNDGSFYRIYITLLNKELTISKKISFSNGTYKVKLSANDFDYLPSSHICIQKAEIKLKNDTLNFDSLFSFITKDCYECPRNISVEECIKSKNRKFKWE